MKIRIVDWSRGRLLVPTAYHHDQILEGSLEDVLRVVGELYTAGLNVMLKHVDAGARIDVDDRWFTQR